MKAFRLLALGAWLSALWMTGTATAQISAGGTPPSFSQAITGTVPTVTMSPVDNQAELALDSQAPVDAPYRFAVQLDVNLNLQNSGTWTTLANGDRIWRLRISSPTAFSIGLIYNDWYLPKGGRLYIYNDDHTGVIGAFTSFNNWSGPKNITGHVAGSATTIEYLEPAAIRGQSRLSISTVCHSYRAVMSAGSPLDWFGASGACEVNINCPAGAGWQAHKHGVAVLYINNSSQCSGTLVNNTAQDFAPYFLTANHCSSNPSDVYFFYFNYESPSCANIDGPTNQTVANATFDAGYSISDFTLLRLSTPVPMSYNPYWAGWDRTGAIPLNFTGIHHPEGDIKKIYGSPNAMYSTDWNGIGPNSHWGDGWTYGAMEPGSSGSPGYDQNGRVIGQLHGGYPFCNPNPYPLALYGKFSVSWNGSGSYGGRLYDWLDPVGNSATLVDGAFPVAAGNDVCPGYYINNLPYTDVGSTNLANWDYAHNDGGSNAPDVVYTMQLPCLTAVTASLCGSLYDTEIEVRTGGACPGSQVIAWNDDFCGLQSQVSLNANAGQVYYIVVYGYAQSAGHFTLNVTGTGSPPVNDDCPGITIGTLPYSVMGGTGCSNHSINHCVYDAGSPDVFYNLTLNSCQLVTVSLCGSNYDTGLEVRAGGSCPGSTVIACNDDYCGLQSQLSFVAQPSLTYFIVIDGFYTDFGSYVLNVTSVPWATPNDQCPGTSITALPYSDVGNTTCATHDYQPDCRTTTSPDVMYSMTLTSCQTVTASLCGSAYDAVIDVRTGGSCPGSVSVACNDDNLCNGFFTLQSTAVFTAAAYQTYYILVSGYNGASGGFDLSVTGVPFVATNDQCPGTLVTALPYTDTGNTYCANRDVTLTCVYGTTASDVFYHLNIPTCQTVTATLCGSGYDTGIEVRTGGACPGTTSVICDDDNFCGQTYTLQSTVSFLATANTDYYIIVGGFASADGPYVLNLTGIPYPQNDVCPGFLISSLPYTDAGNTVCANNDYTWSCPFGGSPDSRDVMYTLNLPTCQEVTASLCGSGYDTGIEARTGGACPGTTSVICDDDHACGGNPTLQSQVTFDAIAGQNYYILVDGYNGDAGPFILNVTGVPCAVPNPPTNLVVKDIYPSGVEVWWQPVPGASFYNVYRAGTNPVPMDAGHLIASTAGTSYLDPNAINDPDHIRFYVVATVVNPPQLLASVEPGYTKDQAATPDPTEVYRSMPAPVLPPKKDAVQGKVEIPAAAYPATRTLEKEIDKSKIAVPATPVVIIIPVDNPEHAAPNKTPGTK